MFITLLWYCCTCNALRAATQVCHTTCSSSSFLTAAPASFTKLRSLLPSFRFISPRSQLNICFSAWHPAPKTQTIALQDAQFLSQATAAVLTGFHSASLRHSFTSVSFSPPAAHFCYARRPPHLGFVHLASIRLIPSVHSPIAAKVHLHSSAPFVPYGKYTPGASYVAAIAPDDRGFPGSPFVGARRPPPFLRSSSLRRPSNGSQSLQPRQVCGAALLPFCRRRFYQ